MLVHVARFGITSCTIVIHSFFLWNYKHFKEIS